VYWGLYPWG